MFTDVAGIGLALLAVWFAAVRPTTERTFGYLRLEILAAVVNAVLLFVIAVFVLVEASGARRRRPRSRPGSCSPSRSIGLLANGVSFCSCGTRSGTA